MHEGQAEGHRAAAEGIQTLMNFALKMMNCALQMMNFALKIMSFALKIMGRIQNDGFCIYNDVFRKAYGLSPKGHTLNSGGTASADGDGAGFALFTLDLTPF